jgi:hypothetical protein
MNVTTMYTRNSSKYPSIKGIIDRLGDLVDRVSGHTTEMCFVSCEVRTEFTYVI